MRSLFIAKSTKTRLLQKSDRCVMNIGVSEFGYDFSGILETGFVLDPDK
ncbi:hypothetical protein ACP6PK_22375 [Dapis sp. BLCC M172]